MITEVKEQLIEPRPRLLAQYLISSRLESLPEGVEESDLFRAYGSDCVYDEREVELCRRKWRDIPVKERPRTACDTLCTTPKESSIYLHSTNHLGYDASLDPLQQQNDLSAYAEKTEDLATKHGDARSDDWTCSHELSSRNTG